MKTIRYSLRSAVVVSIALVAGPLAAAPITIPTVTVGNPDVFTVGYEFKIGKYEVTNAQYTAFLNAVAATDPHGLYNSSHDTTVYGGITRSVADGGYTYATKSGFENKPVNFVSFWDAARFANWLNNGQGSGSTETGAYTLTGGAITANSVTRNAGASWALASEAEWKKAAYYDPTKNGGAGGYWLYATKSDTLADNMAFAATNGANYRDTDYANGGFSGPATTEM